MGEQVDGSTSCSAPLALPFPIGVRTAPTMTASRPTNPDIAASCHSPLSKALYTHIYHLGILRTTQSGVNSMTFCRQLADGTAWSAVGECPIEKTMALLGTKSGMLFLREAYYGTTGSTTSALGSGITRPHLAAGLNELGGRRFVDEAALPRAGHARARSTCSHEVGVDFMPVVWAMFEWGRTHLPTRSPLRLAHADCGAEAGVEVRCAKGHRVPPTS